MNIYGPILPLKLDGRNTPALVKAIQTKIFYESGGKLNDFTPASPLSAISEGQAFAQAELLYYLNNLPEAFSIQWLRQLGIQRRVGSRAYVDITFTRTAGYNRVVIIPPNTQIITTSGLIFLTTQEARILENQSSTTVACVSERWGSVYNIPINSISGTREVFIGVDTITNFEPATGGRDLESVEEMKARAFEVLSRRTLTTSNDFVNEVKLLAPDSSIIKILTYEERNRINSLFSGNVLICVGKTNGEALDNSTLSMLISSISPRVVVGTNISFISPTITPLDVTLSVIYDPSDVTESLDVHVNRLFSTVDTVLSPQNIPLGEDLDIQMLSREVLKDEFVKKINNLSIKLMITDPPAPDGPCAGFSGTEDPNDSNKCIYNYEDVITSENETYVNTDPIKSYKLYKLTLSIISSTTYSPLTYTFDTLYR
jgi:hypothetical protein